MANSAEQPESEQGQGDPTPAPESQGNKAGVHDGNPRRKIVGEYAERPYADAVSKDHLEVLKAAGQEPR